jgi:alkanesulfonate monooxygenase SsuD/methylene tetrahydromethanopterin reductase-like flavin-dependent oxidoreductase (luciferase family)
MAAMGAVTRRLRFPDRRVRVPMRHPFHLAKAIGTAAVLTNYRVSLGIGLGWMRDEFELLGRELRRSACAHDRDDRGDAQALDRRDGRAPRPLLRLRPHEHAAAVRGRDSADRGRL